MRTRRITILVIVAFVICFAAAPPVRTQVRTQQQPASPTLKPIAKASLLMKALAQPNFQGLERILSKRPTSLKSWQFARGQALLIAETGNLLMMRPPKGAGKSAWFARAADLRKTGADLARATAAQDFAKSRTLFVQVANRCNACHSTFRVRVQITPFASK